MIKQERLIALREKLAYTKKWQWYLDLCQDYIDWGSPMVDIFEEAKNEAIKVRDAKK